MESFDLVLACSRVCPWWMLKRNILCTIEYCGWYCWYGDSENWPITHFFKKHLQERQGGSGTNPALRRILPKTKRRKPLFTLNCQWGGSSREVRNIVQARLKIAFQVIRVKMGYTGVKCMEVIVKVWIRLLSIQPTYGTVLNLPCVTWFLQL